MKAKYFITLVILFFSFTEIFSQQSTGIDIMYVINGEEVTEDYVNNLDVSLIKSLRQGATDEEKEILRQKYGDKVDECYFMIVELYTDEELAEVKENPDKEITETEESNKGENTLVSEGDNFIDFEVMMIDSSVVKLSDFEGKVVLLNFWATWCAPCMMELYEMPEIILKDFSDDEFVFIPISVGETFDVVANKKLKFEEKGIDFNLGFDPDKSIFNRYATSSIPRNFLIDKNSKIAYISIGYNEESMKNLHDKIEELLSE